MSDYAWRVDEAEQEPPNSAFPSPALVTMHFLLTALRRRWRVWVGLGCVGMFLGLGWALSSPPNTVGTVTLILAHEPSADPQQAVSTDVSLLRTRTLAAEVIEQLGLKVTPDEFQDSVVSVSASPDVLVLEVTGPDDRAAVARARALADAYLAFRASQIRSQLEALTSGYKERIASLREQTDDLSKQYDEARGLGDDAQTSVLLNRQAQLAVQIESAQQSIEDATMTTDAIIDASSVLDPPARKPAPSAVRTVALPVISGLIGATALGVGFVLFTALTSDRLRLREEVALALATPVRISVGGRLHRRWWPFRPIRLPASALEILVDALDREVSRPAKPWAAGNGSERSHEAQRRFEPTRLALATVDTGGVGQLVVAGLAARLCAQGLDVFVVDLSESGALGAALDGALGEQEDPASQRRPVVFRPERVLSPQREPLDRPGSSKADHSLTDPWPEQWDQADVVVTLAEVDPAVGLEHLWSWVDEVVVLVAAGRSSAERLRTTGELIRSADLRLLFAMMVGADRSDESLGLPETAYREWPPMARRSP